MTRKLSYLENCYVESLYTGHASLAATSVSQRMLISHSAAVARQDFIHLPR